MALTFFIPYPFLLGESVRIFSLFQLKDLHNFFLTAHAGKQTNRNFDIGPKKATFYRARGERDSAHPNDSARKILPKMDSPDIGAMKIFFQKCYISFS